MSIYPELTELSVEALFKKFRGTPIDGADYAALYYDELAEEIIRHGEAGIHFLRSQLQSSNVDRVRAALGALASLKEDPLTLPMLRKALNDARDMVMAEAIDSLRLGGYDTEMNRVLSLLNHPSSYVRGAVLRYVSAFDRDRAIPLLMQSLTDANYIVRENACDELGELEATEAVELLKARLQDEHPDVRDAAQTALEFIQS